MGDILVYLESGFDHDRVTVSAGDNEHVEPDVTTRHQVGLASVVEVEVSTEAPVVLRIALPDRGVDFEGAVHPIETPHVRVNLTDGSLDVRPQAAPPMFA